MTRKTRTLTTALVIIAVAAACGLLAARKSARMARDEYAELRIIFSLDEQRMVARGMIQAGAPSASTDAKRTAPLCELQSLIGFQDQQHEDIPSHEEGGKIPASAPGGCTQSGGLADDAFRRSGCPRVAGVPVDEISVSDTFMPVITCPLGVCHEHSS